MSELLGQLYIEKFVHVYIRDHHGVFFRAYNWRYRWVKEIFPEGNKQAIVNKKGIWDLVVDKRSSKKHKVQRFNS